MNYWILKSNKTGWLEQLVHGGNNRWPHDHFRREGIKPSPGEVLFLWSTDRRSPRSQRGIVAAGVATEMGNRLSITTYKPLDFEVISRDTLKRDEAFSESEFMKKGQGHGIHRVYPAELEALQRYFSPSMRGWLSDQKAVECSGVDDVESPVESGVPDRAKTSRFRFRRDPHIREIVRKRAEGQCEYCHVKGFFLPGATGRYVETHHIIALANHGKDTLENVIALCPTHHREAHYGERAEELEEELVAELEKILARSEGAKQDTY